jgi:putative flippase GtrA
MVSFKSTFQECRLAAKVAGVSLLGFAADFAVLHLAMKLGVPAAWARIVSLFCAMQITFVLNGVFVFRSLDVSRPWRQWAAYMGSNGVGNFCNYLIFVTLVSFHWRVVSAPLFALCVGAFSAWLMNYCCSRLLVFRKAKPKATGLAPDRARAIQANAP